MEGRWAANDDEEWVEPEILSITGGNLETYKDCLLYKSYVLFYPLHYFLFLTHN